MQTYFQKLFEQGFNNLTTSTVNALKPLTTAIKPGLPADNVNMGASTSGAYPGKHSYHKRSRADGQNASPSEVARISIGEGNDTDADGSDEENNSDTLDGSDNAISLPDLSTLDKNIAQLLESPMKRKKCHDTAGEKNSVKFL